MTLNHGILYTRTVKLNITEIKSNIITVENIGVRAEYSE